MRSFRNFDQQPKDHGPDTTRNVKTFGEQCLENMDARREAERREQRQLGSEVQGQEQQAL